MEEDARAFELRVRRLFDEVVAFPEAERPTQIARCCEGDPRLRERLERLFALPLRGSFLGDVRADIARAIGEATQAGAEATGGSGSDPADPPKDNPIRIGPYQVLGTLGEGGMGVVYRARHEESGHERALKTVRVLSPEMLESIRREVHALSRLEHPGVVSIVDEGVLNGTPWYAMELLQGVSLRQVIRSNGWLSPGDGRDDGEGARSSSHSPSLAPTAFVGTETPTHAAIETENPYPPLGGPIFGRPLDPEALPTVLTLMRRLCSSLAYLHGEGLVHRDLKPENILVRPDGRPVLVDFGLSSRFGGGLRDTLEVPEGTAGTFAYMAPEQAMGELVDARADLYALGCVLHEILAGDPPFGFGRGALTAHQSIPPPPLPEEVGPAALRDLVSRLLIKEPRQRLGHADDVASVLVQLGAEEDEEDRNPRPYLYRPSLAGRDRLLAEASRSLRTLRQGAPGSVWLLRGEPGLGKTRLATEVARLARRQRIPVLIGGCRESDKRPLHAFTTPLRAIVERCLSIPSTKHRRQEADRIFGPRGPILSVACALIRELPGQEGLPEPARVSDPAARLRVLTSLGETLDAVCGPRGALLVLEDVHWSDELTREALAFLARRARESRLLLIATQRATPRMSELEDLESVSTVDLQRLDEPAVGEMIEGMLALEEAPPRLSTFLMSQSEGVPLFVAEYLRLAIAQGLLVRDRSGRWRLGDGGEQKVDVESLPLPQTLEGLICERTERLSTPARRLLDAAAVLGREIPEALLGLMAEPASAFEPIQELMMHQILESEEGTLRFAHERIREVTYRRLQDEQRRRLHGLAADAIEASHGDDPEDVQAALGGHWEAAGETAKARACYARAARTAVRHFTPQEAERLYRAHLALAEAPDRDGTEARLELAVDVLERLGDLSPAIIELEKARVEAAGLGLLDLVRRAWQGLGWTHFRKGQFAEAAHAYRESLELARQTGAADQQALAVRGLALIASQTGRKDEALDQLNEALALARQGDAPSTEAFVLGDLGALHHQLGRIAESRRFLEDEVSVARQSGDRWSEGTSLGNLAGSFMVTGELERSEELYTASLQIARETHNAISEEFNLGNLSILRRKQGDSLEALALGEKAIALARRIGDRPGEGRHQLNHGITLTELGRIPEAEATFEDALRIKRELGDVRGESLTLAQMSDLNRWMGRLDDAEAHGARAQELAAEVNDLPNVVNAACIRGHVALAHAAVIGNESALKPAQALLTEARNLARSLKAEPGWALSMNVARLQRACEAASAAEGLVCGRLREDVPAPILRWLQNTRPEAQGGTS